MIVAIRNASGFDLFLAISADEQALLIRVSLEAPSNEAHVEKIRAGEGFGIPNCPDGIGVRVRCPKGLLYAAKHREILDHLDQDGEIDGDETYLEFTIRILN